MSSSNTLSLTVGVSGSGTLSDASTINPATESFQVGVKSSQFPGDGVVPQLSLQTGATPPGEANQWYLGQRSVNATSFDLLNIADAVSGLVNGLGQPIDLAKVLGLLIVVNNHDGIKNLRIGPQAQTHAWQGPFSGIGADQYLTIYWACSSPTTPTTASAQAGCDDEHPAGLQPDRGDDHLFAVRGGNPVMGDILEHVARGQPFAVKADTWNQILDTVSASPALPGPNAGAAGLGPPPLDDVPHPQRQRRQPARVQRAQAQRILGAPATIRSPGATGRCSRGSRPSATPTPSPFSRSRSPTASSGSAACWGCRSAGPDGQRHGPLGDGQRRRQRQAHFNLLARPGDDPLDHAPSGGVYSAVVLVTGTPADASLANWIASINQAKGHGSGGATWINVSSCSGSGSGSGSGGGGCNGGLLRERRSALFVTASNGDDISLSRYEPPGQWFGQDSMGNDWGFYCGTDAGQTGFWLYESGQDDRRSRRRFSAIRSRSVS